MLFNESVRSGSKDIDLYSNRHSLKPKIKRTDDSMAHEYQRYYSNVRPTTNRSNAIRTIQRDSDSNREKLNKKFRKKNSTTIEAVSSRDATP